MQPAGDRVQALDETLAEGRREHLHFAQREQFGDPGQMSIELENELGGRQLAGWRRRPCLAFFGRQDGVEMALQPGDGLEIAAAAAALSASRRLRELDVPFGDLRLMTVAIERNPDALHFANGNDARAHETAHLTALAREFVLLLLMDQEGHDGVEGGIEELGAGQRLRAPIRDRQPFRQDEVEEIAGDAGERHGLPDEAVRERRDAKDVEDDGGRDVRLFHESPDVEGGVGGDQRLRPQRREHAPAELVEVEDDSAGIGPAEDRDQPDAAPVRIQSQSCRACRRLPLAQRSGLGEGDAEPASDIAGAARSRRRRRAPRPP